MLRVCKNRSPDQFSTETIPLVCDIRDVQHSFDLERMYNEKRPVNTRHPIVSHHARLSLLFYTSNISNWNAQECSVSGTEAYGAKFRSSTRLHRASIASRWLLLSGCLCITAVLEILWTLSGNTPNITNKCYVLVPGPVLVHQHKEQNRGHLPRPQQPTIAWLQTLKTKIDMTICLSKPVATFISRDYTDYCIGSVQ